MTEHEIFMARRQDISRTNHGIFRRKHLLAEKAERRITHMRNHFLRTGELLRV